MSSDESSHEDGHGEPTYIVVKRNWRSHELNEFLRVIDCLHLWGRYRGKWEASSGGWPHFRSTSLDTQSARPAVSKLSINCYGPNWLAGQNTFAIDMLSIVTQPFPLTFQQDVLEYVTFLSNRNFSSLFQLSSAGQYDSRDRRAVTGRAGPSTSTPAA